MIVGPAIGFGVGRNARHSGAGLGRRGQQEDGIAEADIAGAVCEGDVEREQEAGDRHFREDRGGLRIDGEQRAIIEIEGEAAQVVDVGRPVHRRHVDDGFAHHVAGEAGGQALEFTGQGVDRGRDDEGALGQADLCDDDGMGGIGGQEGGKPGLSDHHGDRIAHATSSHAPAPSMIGSPVSVCR